MCKELMRSNPNNTLKIYACIEACNKASFVTICIPLIGLDGCFPKRDFGGQLFAVIFYGNHGNNQMLPITYAMVKENSKDSCCGLGIFEIYLELIAI